MVFNSSEESRGDARQSSFKDAALSYAGRGWAVFPLKGQQKVPATIDGFKSASTDPITVNRWWSERPNSNIGIATGAISSFFVIDVDDPQGLVELEREGPLPPTLRARTGTGGQHLLFEYPGVPIKNRARFLPGLDVRGDGGYIVAPPSLHPNGCAYTWLNDLTPAKAPDWLVELVVKKKPERVSVPVKPPQFVAGMGTAWGCKVLLEEIAKVASALEGKRNDLLNCAAFAVFGAVKGGQVDEAAAWQALRAAASWVGLGEGEIANTLKSAYRAAEARQPRPRLIVRVRGGRS